MIWKNSKYFGIGKARTRTGKLIVVANYMPAGNIPLEFADNIFRPLHASVESRRNTLISSNRRLIRINANKLLRKRQLSPKNNELNIESAVQ